MLKNYFQRVGVKRILMTVVGNIFIGLGIGIFKLSGLGNDPFTGMNMSLAACVGLEYAHFQVIFNLCLFVVQWFLGKEFIGVGTIVNACFLGYIVTFFYNVLYGLLGVPHILWLQVLVVCIGVVICSFGLSLYQTSDVGVAPYDSLSLITRKHLPRIPYFWHRILDDGIAALVCYLAGGIVGLGTLVSAFGLGPFIHFFNEHFSKKLLISKKNEKSC
ncbi:MAG: YitT family protein [Acetatifactor sp.]